MNPTDKLILLKALIKARMNVRNVYEDLTCAQLDLLDGEERKMLLDELGELRCGNLAEKRENQVS